MRKLVLISFLTLDGVMQGPGGENEDVDGDFPYGAWQVPFFNDSDSGMPPDLKQASAFLIGRKTYDIFSKYWPTEGKSVPEWGDFMNVTKKYVASRTLKNTDWQNSELLKGDAAEAVARIKKESGGPIFIWGSGDLCQTLLRHDLIDEMVLQIHPLTLGVGKKLFKEGVAKKDFELVGTKTTKMGVIHATYKLKR